MIPAWWTDFWISVTNNDDFVQQVGLFFNGDSEVETLPQNTSFSSVRAVIPSAVSIGIQYYDTLDRYYLFRFDQTTITVVDASTDTPIANPVGPARASGIGAIVPSEDAIFFALQTDFIGKLDLSTNTLSTLGGFSSVAFRTNPAYADVSGYIYFPGSTAGVRDLFVYDPSTDSEVTRISGFGGSQLTSCVYSTVTQMLYVVESGASFIWVVDPQMNVISGTIPTTGTVTSPVFSVNYGPYVFYSVGAILYRYNANTDISEVYTDNQDLAAFLTIIPNPDRDLVAVATNNSFSNTVYLINSGLNSSLSDVSGGQLSAFAWDTARSRLLIARFGSPFPILEITVTQKSTLASSSDQDYINKSLRSAPMRVTHMKYSISRFDPLASVGINRYDMSGTFQQQVLPLSEYESSTDAASVYWLKMCQFDDPRGGEPLILDGNTEMKLTIPPQSTVNIHIWGLQIRREKLLQDI